MWQVYFSAPQYSFPSITACLRLSSGTNVFVSTQIGILSLNPHLHQSHLFHPTAFQFFFGISLVLTHFSQQQKRTRKCNIVLSCRTFSARKRRWRWGLRCCQRGKVHHDTKNIITHQLAACWPVPRKSKIRANIKKKANSRLPGKENKGLWLWNGVRFLFLWGLQWSGEKVDTLIRFSCQIMNALSLSVLIINGSGATGKRSALTNTSVRACNK